MTEDDQEIELIDSLYCTICFRDLNHSLYKICLHPVLPVAICLLCNTDLVEKEKEIEEQKASLDEENEEDNEERCDWCLDGGELFLCDHCDRQFCRTCLTFNLGEDYVAEIRVEDSWTCIACSPGPLAHLTKAMEAGRAASVFRNLEELPQQTVNEEVLENTLATVVGLLESMVEEADESTRRLEPDKELEVEDEIRKELTCKLNTRQSASLNICEEMENYREHWRGHLDLIQHQEAVLAEYLAHHHCDILELPCYKRYKCVNESVNDIQDRMRAELAMRERDQLYRTAEVESDDDSDSSKSENENDSPNEHGANALQQLEEKVSLNELVASYQKYDDPPRAAYPKSFDKDFPKSLLKALYYATSSEVSELSKLFFVPPHVALVMSAASLPCPVSVKKWDFASHVHKAVCKALYYCKNSIDQAILCEFYNLDKAVCAVEDIGKSEDVFALHHRSKKGSSIMGELTLKDLKEAVKCEEDAVNSHFANIKESAHNRSKRGCLTSYEEQALQSAAPAILVTDCNEEADLATILKERDDTFESVRSSNRRPRRRLDRAVSKKSQYVLNTEEKDTLIKQDVHVNDSGEASGVKKAETGDVSAVIVVPSEDEDSNSFSSDGEEWDVDEEEEEEEEEENEEEEGEEDSKESTNNRERADSMCYWHEDDTDEVIVVSRKKDKKSSIQQVVEEIVELDIDEEDKVSNKGKQTPASPEIMEVSDVIDLTFDDDDEKPILRSSKSKTRPSLFQAPIASFFGGAASSSTTVPKKEEDFHLLEETEHAGSNHLKKLVKNNEKSENFKDYDGFFSPKRRYDPQSYFPVDEQTG
eukprot:scaffold1885_cov161-Ochromonas_danica.AAC.15